MSETELMGKNENTGLSHSVGGSPRALGLLLMRRSHLVYSIITKASNFNHCFPIICVKDYGVFGLSLNKSKQSICIWIAEVS